MSRAERLLQLVQILRRHRRPVSGAVLAGELNVSLRTLYRDIASLQSQGATRTPTAAWPIALAFFDRARVVVAWCESRRAFRHFRADRIAALVLTEERYPRRREAMLREWREAEGIATK